MKRILLFTAVGIAGCSYPAIEPGDECLAYPPPQKITVMSVCSHPDFQIFGHDSSHAPARTVFIPLGTKLRVTSSGPGNKVIALILEGKHRNESVIIDRS
jgi:hypothetical protein